MDNKILPSSGSHDFYSFAVPTRKRKLRSPSITEAKSDGLFHGTSGQGNTYVSSIDENVMSEPPTFHSREGFTDIISQRGDHVRSDCQPNESEPTDVVQQQHSSTERVLSTSETILASSDKQDCLNSVSRKIDDNRLPCGKTTSMGFEKLWDGSLQLNSSITMSAVAFFRSGERLVDIKWSKFVKVKGKVRLGAFEKYMLDLPRSRTRGLMVISLCAKDGASDNELKRIREVARGYRKGERVGFAHFSQDVGLYLCPQSDKIFKILAKYGLFKGRIADQGKSDSFIGCVVWRKNQTTVGSVANQKNSNNSSSKEFKKSPSDSSTAQQSGKTETSSCPVQTIQNPISATLFSAVENKFVTGNSSVANLSMPPPIPGSSSNTAVEQGSGHLNLSSHASKGQSLKTDDFSAGFSMSEQPKACLGFPKISSSLADNVMKQMVPTADDDDLPEYDFGSACGVDFTLGAMPTGAPAGTSLQTGRAEKVDGAILPVMPVVCPVSASKNGPDNLRNPKHSSNVNQGVPLPAIAANHEPQIHVSGKLAEQHGFQKYVTPATASTLPYALPKRNIFSDHEDDMPEWIPPQHQVPSSVERHKPSAVMPSESPAPMFKNQQVFLRPLLRYPSSATIHPEITSRGLPQPHLPPIYIRLPPPVSSQNGSSSLTGFQHIRALRPPSGSFETNLPVRPADGRDWRV